MPQLLDNDEESPNEVSHTRRRLLIAAGLGAGLVPLGALTKPAMGEESSPAALPPFTPATINQRMATQTMCTLTPQAVEGPFYVDKAIVRSDIREGQQGKLLKLRVMVRNSNTLLCNPLKGALVSVWQCNAFGYYSGHSNENPDHIPNAIGTPPETIKWPWPQSGTAPTVNKERFLRGVQPCDDTGSVEFITIFPSWYATRTPHIHLKVFLGSSEAITTQFFFPQSLINDVLGKDPPYAKRGMGLYYNENDNVRKQSRLSGSDNMFLMSFDPDAALVGTATIGISHV